MAMKEAAHSGLAWRSKRARFSTEKSNYDREFSPCHDLVKLVALQLLAVL